MDISMQLQQLLQTVQRRSETFIGYPAGVQFDYAELFPFLQYNMNNVGDPFVDAPMGMNTRSFEREVIQFFAELFEAPSNNWWGYVTNGGSEGNLYGLYLARELYPEGMVYYSESTHYSVQKNVHLLNMPSIVIRTNEKGEMDYDDLKDTLQLNRHRPAIILANIGTTMTEAKDDVPKIKTILKSCALKSHYIHCDAALAGVYLPLVQDQVSFNFPSGADSIAVSGHKFIGSPIPCGVVIAKKSYKDRIGQSVPYIGNLDTTITGSRNAITPLFLWYGLKQLEKDGLKERAFNCLQLADWLVQQLNAIGCSAWRNQNALTVVFPQPSQKICHKWQLASEAGISHVICMPGVAQSQLQLFVEDMKDWMDNPIALQIETAHYHLN